MALPAPCHDDASRFDFAEAVRSHNYRRSVRRLLEDYPRRVDAAGSPKPLTKEEVAPLYERDPDYLFTCAVQRSMQQLAWTTAVDSVHRDGDLVAEELARSSVRQEHGHLELIAETELPDWYTRHTREGLDDIHLVPGGYWKDPLVGAVYDRGGAVYRLAWRGGYDARPGALEHFVRQAPRLDYARVLDMGCSFGGLTRVLRKVLADAEVVGIDISAPALAYAHQVSEQAGLSITYSQRDATATGYEDASFDLVTAFLLLHEVPDDVRAQVVAEAFRLLRPGGQVMFLDIPPYSALSPEDAYFESFDGRGNGESFWEEFLSSDFPRALRAVGFEDPHDGPLEFDEPGYWGSSALWRTGTFDRAHRWVTVATKPSEQPR